MSELTPKAESVLKDILEHKKPNGYYDADYWAPFFNESCPDKELIRSCFKELKDNGMIETQWADNRPFYITVTSLGLSFFEIKEAKEKEKKKEKRRSLWRDILLLVIGAVLGAGTTLLLKLFGIS